MVYSERVKEIKVLAVRDVTIINDINWRINAN